MDEYTPTDGDIRARIGRGPTYGFGDAWLAAFDRWLAEHDRVVAANAWDEGHRHCFHVENPNNPIKGNPYRITEENN